LHAANFGRRSGVWPVRRIAYDPQGRLVAVAKSLDGTLILGAGAGAGGERRGVILRDGQTDSTGVAFSAAGDRLVTTSEDSGDARVWDVSECVRASCKPQLLRTLQHPCVVHTAVFSPDGKRVLTGCGDHIARVWTWEDRHAAPVTLRGHTGNVRAVAFTPDGRRAVTAGTDRTTRIWDWDARSGRRILGVEQMHTDRVRSVAVDPKDSETILTSSDDGTARLYECTACFTLDRLQRVAEDLHQDVHPQPAPSSGR
jgi:WD40 repeat protein